MVSCRIIVLYAKIISAVGGLKAGDLRSVDGLGAAPGRSIHHSPFPREDGVLKLLQVRARILSPQPCQGYRPYSLLA
jgi:hypothetical protein